MTEPLPLPLRVLVKGASTVVWTSWMGGPRSDFAYPRAIEDELLAAGQPAEVRTTAIASQRTKDAFRTWQHDVVMWSPDVVVLQYGHYECIHRFLPWWFERHANTLARRPGRIRQAYRTRVLRPLWMLGAKGQQAVDARLAPTAAWWRRGQVATQLEELIRRIRSVGSPLVIVPEIPPPGRTYVEWFPGIAGRIDAMNDTLGEVVERFDHPEVRLFPLRATIAPLVPEGEEATPDGGHLTPALHRAVGRGLAEMILDWAATQSHLHRGERRLHALGDG